MKIKPIIFIAAGGKGSRLWNTFPELKTSGLPKSVGLVIKNKPLIYYQLNVLKELDGIPIIISFNNTNAASTFNNYVSMGTFPKLNYYINIDSPPANPTTIDIIKSSTPNQIESFDYNAVILTSGDVYFDQKHLKSCLNTMENTRCNVQTLCDFRKYMITLEKHFHPKYDVKNYLLGIDTADDIPNEIICHPQFLLKQTFEVYKEQPLGISKSEFVSAAMKKKHQFKVVKPVQYVNLNFPEDYEKMLTFV